MPESGTSRQEILVRLMPFRASHTWVAAGMLILDLSLYGILWTLLLRAPSWSGKLALAAGASLCIARLFVIGHDACHGSYLPGRWGNAIVARLAFLFSYTPHSTWELGHNTLHHGFTNLRGKDYVYTPLAKCQYDQLPAWGRLVERIYRHPLGPGLCYLIEIWWKKLWFPRARHVEHVRPIYYADSLLTAAFLAAQVAVVWFVARQTGQNAPLLAVCAVALPFGLWNMLMGFVTFQHHTHPSVTWYAHRRDWDPLRAQVENTVHVVFPWPVNALLGNIMEHTAHHLDVKIPLFELPRAQRSVEEIFAVAVPVERWTWRGYLDCCRRCKLYDYERRTWLDFAGRPTGPPPSTSGR